MSARGSSGDDGLAGSAISMLVAVIVIALVVTISGALLGAVVFGGNTVSFDPEPGSAETLDADATEVPNDANVRLTLENAVKFEENGYVSTSSPTTVSGGWTVCTVARIDFEAEDKAVAYDLVSINETDIQLQYDNRTSGGPYWVAYYDNATQGDVVLRAAASSPTQRTPVCARYDTGSNNVTLAVGGAVQATGQPGDGGSRYAARDLYGSIDEIRVTNNSVADSRLSEYATEPTLPWKGEDRVARVMFNEGSGTSTTVYYRDVDAELTNPVWINGVESATLSEPADYEFSVDNQTGWQITPQAGGKMDGAPVAFVTSDRFGLGFTGALTTLSDIAGVAFGILAVGVILIPAVAIVLHLRDGPLGDASKRLRR